MCYRIVAGDHLMSKVLLDASTAVSVLARQKVVDSKRIGVVGHSFGGNTALFLAALDERIGFSCASGAACSYRHKMRRGTGLDMSLVIPGCTQVFDIDDLVRCVAPRRILIVSSDGDALTGDAHEIIESVRPVFDEQNCAEHLSHFHSSGPHALDRTRFEAMIEWVSREALQTKTV